MEVHTRIFRRFVVPQESRAYLVQPAVGFGSSRFEIRPGPPGKLLPDDGSVPIQGFVVSGLDSVIPESTLASLERFSAQVGNFAEALTPAARDIHELLERRRPSDVDAQDADVVGNISSAVQRLDAVLKTANDVLGEPGTQNKLVETVENMRAASAEARSAAENFNRLSAGLEAVPQDIQAMTQRFERLAEEADVRVQRLAQVMIEDAESLGRALSALESITRSIDEGRGTVGKLLVDEKLYEALVLTVERLDETLQEMQVLIRKLEREGVVKPFGM
jgi:ABC-type transporter Mla subunit MlaD